MQQGTDVATAKQLAKLQALDVLTVASLSEVWYERKILGSYEHPEVVERVLRRHIRPVICKLPVQEVRPNHIDRVLTQIVDAGAPTVANDALRHLVRMVEARAQCRLLIMSLALSRDRDKGRAMTRIRRPDGACDFQSGQQRHHHVEQRDLWQEAPEFREGLFTIVADMDFVAIEPMPLAAVLITARPATN